MENKEPMINGKSLRALADESRLTWERQLDGRLERIARQWNRKIDFVSDYISSIPLKYRRRQVEAMLGELTSGKAIKQTCFECVGFEDVEERVKTCNSIPCPLHPYRPYK